MKVKIKRLSENAVIPTYSREGDAGLDLVATSKYFDEYGNAHYGTGLAFAIPENHVGLLFPRSSNAKKDLLLSNSVGVLDSNYRGELSFKFKPSVVFFNNNYAENEEIGEITDNFDDIVAPTKDNDLELQDYNVGDRIGQIIIIPIPQIEFEEVGELTQTNRQDGSYGSTGK